MSDKQDIVERLHELKTTDAFAQVRLNKGIEEIERLRSELAKVTAERDEARREVLLWLGERCSRKELTQEIKNRGWEYLGTEERRDALDRLSKLDEELGLQ